jgi:LysM repeat protein
MAGRSSVLLAAGSIAVVLSLAGCAGDENSSAATVAPIQPTSYVVKELVTTTTTLPPTTTTTIPGMIYEDYTHTITSGDNPSYLADLYSISLADLSSANSTNPDYSSFPIGGSIVIPPGALLPSVVGGQVVQPSSDGGSCTTTEHVVVAGDNPTVVANSYGITIEALARANATNPVYASFILGGTLLIPSSGC